MNVWKILAWTSPLWMVAECTLFLSMPYSTWQEKVDLNTPYLNEKNLCSGLERICDEQVVVENPNDQTNDNSNKANRTWNIPEGFKGRGYFDRNGRWLGGEPIGERYSKLENLSDFLLLDVQDWFSANVDTPLEEWRLVEPRIVAAKNYIIERDGALGVLDGLGGWVIEPQRDAEITLNGYKCSDALRVTMENQVKIIARDHSFEEVFDNDQLSGKTVVQCDYPFFTLENDDHYELYFHNKQIYAVDAKLLPVERISDDLAIVTAYFGNDDTQSGIINSKGEWPFELDHQTFVLRDAEYRGTDYPYLEIRRDGEQSRTYMDTQLYAIDEPEEVYDNTMRDSIDAPDGWSAQHIGRLSYGLAPVSFSSNSRRSIMGYVNSEGHIVISPIFVLASGSDFVSGTHEFNDMGLAKVYFCEVSMKCGQGYIDASGEWVISPNELQNFQGKNIREINDVRYVGNNRFMVNVK